MRCAICEQPICSGQLAVPTSDGAAVHLACTEREAAATWAARRRWAWLHLLGVALVAGLLVLLGHSSWALALIGIGLLTHVLIHRRFWHYLRRDICRWLGLHRPLSRE